MAPVVVEVMAGSAAKEFKKESATARLLGSGEVLASRSPACNSDMVRFRWYR